MNTLSPTERSLANVFARPYARTRSHAHERRPAQRSSSRGRRCASASPAAARTCPNSTSSKKARS